MFDLARSFSFCAFFLSVGCIRASAADFSVEVSEQQDGGIPTVTIHLSGPIGSNDVAELERLVKELKSKYPGVDPIADLSSDGGNFSAGIDMAILLNREGMRTLVRRGERCMSACAIAFLGGASAPQYLDEFGQPDQSFEQRPRRFLEDGAVIGFHAPYLVLPSSSYDANMVETAYKAAAFDLTRFFSITGQLHVPREVIPKMLQLTKNDFYQVDNDAVRYLSVGYDPIRFDIPDYHLTLSGVRNFCVNYLYHIRGQSSFEGAAFARTIDSEFRESSVLLENGEDNLYRHPFKGSLYLPIARSASGTGFLWCVYRPLEIPTFREAGTFSQVIARDADKVSLPREDSASRLSAQIDFAPPGTKLEDVDDVLFGYAENEDALDFR